MTPGGIPGSHEDLLRRKGFADMATIGPRGEPHCTPVWYAYGKDGPEVNRVIFRVHPLRAYTRGEAR